MENQFKISLGGLVINDQGEWLLIRQLGEKGIPGKITFPGGELQPVEGQAWEVMEDQIAKLVYSQTGIEIADGPIPFTDQAFMDKEGFDHLMQFFICRYKFGKPVTNEPESIAEVFWQKFTDFNSSEFEQIHYLVFEKANKFIQQLSS